MSTIFRGDYEKIQKYAARVNDAGYWRDLKHGCKQYRTDDGAILNWWKKSGKITFQGHRDAAAKFESAFKALGYRAGRMRCDSEPSAGKTERENKNLRMLVADVSLENARLQRLLKERCGGHRRSQPKL